MMWKMLATGKMTSEERVGSRTGANKPETEVVAGDSAPDRLQSGAAGGSRTVDETELCRNDADGHNVADAEAAGEMWQLE
jgi:hypothetical protein